MSAFWAYFWAPFAVALLIGSFAGLVAWRRRAKRNKALLIGVASVVALAGLWHGPFGAADRFSAQVERSAREMLDYYEMSHVTARLHHGPLTRQLILAGPADDFQSSELVRIMGSLPGVSRARWTATGGGLPLIVEGEIAAVLGFLFGLLLAYLLELRRRYNAQWNW